MKRSYVVAAFAAVASAVASYLTLRAIALRSGASSPSSSSSSLADRVVEAARALAPCAYGTPTWDDIMGGKIAPGKWRCYEDGYGTTCGVFAAKVLADAGADPSYINRAPPEGSGFKIADHIARIERAAIAAGTIVRDADLKPGDVYHATHDNPPGEHVGIVVARDGNTITTADGGQTDAAGHQCSKVCTRTLTGDVLQRTDAPAGPMKVTWRVSL